MQDVRRLPVEGNDEVAVTLDELAREGARRMIAAALEAEVEQYVAAFVEEIDEDGKRLVVRNGHARERGLTVGAGTMRLCAPRVNDKRVDEAGKRERFSSRILPAYARRSPKVTKGAGSKKAALAMAYKLLDAAQQRWRRFNGHELIADVLDGVVFKDGERVIDEDNDNSSIDEKVAV